MRSARQAPAARSLRQGRAHRSRCRPRRSAGSCRRRSAPAQRRPGRRRETRPVARRRRDARSPSSFGRAPAAGRSARVAPSRNRQDESSSQPPANKHSAISCSGEGAGTRAPGSSDAHNLAAPTNAPLAVANSPRVPSQASTPSSAAPSCATAIGISSPPSGSSTTLARIATSEVPPKHSTRNGAVEIHARRLSSSAFEHALVPAVAAPSAAPPSRAPTARSPDGRASRGSSAMCTPTAKRRHGQRGGAPAQRHQREHEGAGRAPPAPRWASLRTAKPPAARAATPSAPPPGAPPSTARAAAQPQQREQRREAADQHGHVHARHRQHVRHARVANGVVEVARQRRSPHPAAAPARCPRAEAPGSRRSAHDARRARVQQPRQPAHVLDAQRAPPAARARSGGRVSGQREAKLGLRKSGRGGASWRPATRAHPAAARCRVVSDDASCRPRHTYRHRRACSAMMATSAQQPPSPQAVRSGSTLRRASPACGTVGRGSAPRGSQRPAPPRPSAPRPGRPARAAHAAQRLARRVAADCHCPAATRAEARPTQRSAPQRAQHQRSQHRDHHAGRCMQLPSTQRVTRDFNGLRTTIARRSDGARRRFEFDMPPKSP